MPIPTAYADIFRDWDKLLEAVRKHLESLPELEPLFREMERIAREAQVLKGDQEELRARQQQATQDLKGKIREGRDLAIVLRGAVRSKIGPRNERLVQFGIAPLRRRGPRSRKNAPESAVNPEPGPEPGPETPPAE